MYNKELILNNVLNWAEGEKYFGYSKFDALNSPLLYLISRNSKILRSVFIYLISRSPINVRKFFFVNKQKNPKGLALFARTYFNLFRLTGDKSFYHKGIDLIEILIPLSKKFFFQDTAGAMFSFMSASQFILFAMWFDIEANKDLK
jgi:hypothetical protein